MRGGEKRGGEGAWEKDKLRLDEDRDVEKGAKKWQEARKG